MIKNVSYLSFDFVFALGVILCLLTPSLIMARPCQNIKVTIVKDDTTINNKNGKALSAKAHEKVVKNTNKQ